MSRYIFKLADLGEGTVEAEIVAWRVKVGDQVVEEAPLVEVMTEKAVVEVSSPVSGKVVSLSGAPGDRIPVGAELAVFETASSPPVEKAPEQKTIEKAPPARPSSAGAAPPKAQDETQQRRMLTSPAIRRRAREAGVDLHGVTGSGPNGRIMREDLTRHLASPSKPLVATAEIEEIKVIGLRRLIAQRMSESKRTIPHFSYIEEVDVTQLEALRRHLNAQPGAGPALTYLPFVVLALARTLEDFPQCNGHYDAAREMLVRRRALHAGIATQTPDGLKVPVVRNAQALTLEDLAAEIRRVTEAARTNRATREELTGSTLTVTSLGKLGGIASTPIINAPELGIIGLNRAVERPMVVGGQVVVRRMMNISASFDHRFVDGYDVAAMIQSLKDKLEHPATILHRKTSAL